MHSLLLRTIWQIDVELWKMVSKKMVDIGGLSKAGCADQ